LYGSGSFLHDLRRHFEDNEMLAMSEISKRDEILDAIKIFLGKGK
jgi:hypothetical protein